MKVFVVTIVCLMTLGICPATCDPFNQYGEDFDFECQPGECLSDVAFNVITNTRLNLNDISFEFSCQKIEGYGKQFCDEYTEINNGTDLILFQCPPNSYIAGLNSVFIGNETFSDRVWDIKCCRTLGLCTRNCHLDTELRPEYVPSGWFSTYDETQTLPRQYFFEVCTLEDCGSPKLIKYIHHPWSK